MKLAIALFIGLICTSLNAVAMNPVDEIATRSGLPASEVVALLTNCDVSQTSMNFCAWRDQLVADQNLQLAISHKTTQFPACKSRLEKQTARWTRQRDLACRKGAQQDWGNGSIHQAAQAICVTKETQRITGKVKAFHCQ